MSKFFSLVFLRIRTKNHCKKQVNMNKQLNVRSWGDLESSMFASLPWDQTWCLADQRWVTFGGRHNSLTQGPCSWCGVTTTGQKTEKQIDFYSFVVDFVHNTTNNCSGLIVTCTPLVLCIVYLAMHIKTSYHLNGIIKHYIFISFFKNIKTRLKPCITWDIQTRMTDVILSAYMYTTMHVKEFIFQFT